MTVLELFRRGAHKRLRTNPSFGNALITFGVEASVLTVLVEAALALAGVPKLIRRRVRPLSFGVGIVVGVGRAALGAKDELGAAAFVPSNARQRCPRW